MVCQIHYLSFKCGCERDSSSKELCDGLGNNSIQVKDESVQDCTCAKQRWPALSKQNKATSFSLQDAEFQQTRITVDAITRWQVCYENTFKPFSRCFQSDNNASLYSWLTQSSVKHSRRRRSSRSLWGSRRCCRWRWRSTPTPAASAPSSPRALWTPAGAGSTGSSWTRSRCSAWPRPASSDPGGSWTESTDKKLGNKTAVGAVICELGRMIKKTKIRIHMQW